MPVEGGFYRWTRAAFGDFWDFLPAGGTGPHRFCWAGVCRFVHRLSRLLLSEDDVVATLPRLRCADRPADLDQRARHSDGRPGRGRAGDFYFCAGDDHDRHRAAPLASQSIYAVAPPHQARFKIFGVGLALGLWLYSGYEQLSTVAEEVENPQRAYPRALALVVPLSIAAYFMRHWQLWPRRATGSSGTQASSPTPRVCLVAMAGHVDDTGRNGRLRGPAKQHGADDYAHAVCHGGRRIFARVVNAQALALWTPWLAIVVSTGIYALLAWQSLAELISIYIWLRSATTVLTVLSAWKLRRTQPELKRPFKIPGGRAGCFTW